MPIKYAIKHVFRSWHLFIALLIGIVLATAFFAGIDTKANMTTQQVLDQQLSTVYKDMEISPLTLNLSQIATIENQLSQNQRISGFDVTTRANQQAFYNHTTTNQSAILFPTIAGIKENSRIYDGWTNRPSQGLAANLTYLVEDVYSKNSGQPVPQIGDVVQFNFTRIENNSVVICP